MGHLTHDMFESILGRCRGRKPEVYVETGTNRGDQLIVARDHFRYCIGVELDSRYFQMSKTRVPEATMYLGDSREHVQAFAKTLEEPVFFLLDAHYCALNPPVEKSPFPLWDELIAIRARKHADIVVVDDVHTFGKTRDDLRFGDSPEWEGVTKESIASFLGAKGEEMGDGFVVWRAP